MDELGFGDLVQISVGRYVRKDIAGCYGIFIRFVRDNHGCRRGARVLIGHKLFMVYLHWVTCVSRMDAAEIISVKDQFQTL